MVKSLKSQKLLRTFYRDGLRGYRLTLHGKEALCEDNPSRFSYALTGATETNHIKSELTRRLRLHRVAETIVTMLNAGVQVHRDEKPDIFSPSWEKGVRLFVTSPTFYISREVKELGRAFVKIHGARSVGMLLCTNQYYVVYNLGDSLMKWDYKSEMRTKAMMKSILSTERLSHQYSVDSIHGLLMGNRMELAYEILTSRSGSQYFVLDKNYDHFYFLTNNHQGQQLLRLLCDSELQAQLEDMLLEDFYEQDEGSTFENDAFDEEGNPVLLGYFCDLPRIQRFNTALELQKHHGVLFCFDFQKETLSRYCCDWVTFQSIDFQKWERSFLE